jgi:8-oxo-dGTP diphosphatase
MSVIDSLWRTGLRAAYRVMLAWWFVRRPKKHGSHVAVWHGERLLVIQNSYRKLLSLPAGGPRRGESFLDAAVRELREEVGVRAEPSQLAYYGEVVHPMRYVEDHGHFFELRCAEAPAVRVDRREVIWAEFLAVDDALARGVSGVLRRYLASRAQRGAAERSPSG